MAEQGCFVRLLAWCRGKKPVQTDSGPPGRQHGGASGPAAFPEELPPEPEPIPIPPAERCLLEGPGLQEVAGFAGQSTSFTIACFKQDNSDWEAFVLDNLVVELTGAATLVPTIARTKAGARVSYTARKAGTYTIKVQYFSDPVPGSPFTVGVLPGRIDGARSSVEQPSGLVQGVMVVPLFMEQRVRIITRDKCGNERNAGGLRAGFQVEAELIAADSAQEEEGLGSRTANEDRAWQLARKKPALAGRLRKQRFGGFAGWEACYFCLAGDALFFAAGQHDAQPRGILYLEGSRVRELGDGRLELFVPLAYSRANLMKEKQVNRVFTLKADSKAEAAKWAKAISNAKPLMQADLVTERDGHAVGQGLDAGDIASLRAQIASSEQRQEGGGVDTASNGSWELVGEDELQEAAAADPAHVRPEVREEGGGGGGPRGGGAAGGGGGAGLTSKQARVQAAMRDQSLSPQERQKKIQEIMREPPPPVEELEEARRGGGGEQGGGGAASGGGGSVGGAGSKQARVKAVMADTNLTPQDRQRKIQAIMAERETRPASSRDSGRLLEEQKRVKALLQAGRAQLGELNHIEAAPGGDGDGEAAEGDGGEREVEVRLVVGASDAAPVGEEDILPLGPMPGSSTVGEVKAAAAFGVAQLQQLLAAEQQGAPAASAASTLLLLGSTGEALVDHSRELQSIAPEQPRLTLLLVSKHLQHEVQGQLAAQGGMLAAEGAGAHAVAAEEAVEEELPPAAEEEEEEGGEAGNLSASSCSMQVEDNGDGSYWVYFAFVARGIFRFSVRYKGVTLENGSFQVEKMGARARGAQEARIAQSKKGGRAAAKAVSEQEGDAGGYIHFPAMLLAEGQDGAAGGGKEQWSNVEVRFTWRSMTLYKTGGLMEQLTGLKLFQSRILGCALKSYVRFSPVPGRPEVGVSDGSGQELVLSSPHRHLIHATFYLLLQGRLAGAGGTFNQRREHFHRLLKRLHPAPRGALVLRVRRNMLVSDAFSNCRDKGDSVWRQEWQIRFEGEAGVDWGGLQREMFTLLGRELTDSKKHHGGGPLFKAMGSESAPLKHPAMAATSSKQLELFNFLGKVIGKCLYDAAVHGSHHLLATHFTRSFFKMLLAIPISYHDFQTDDPQLYTSKVKYMLENNIDDAGLDITMTEEEYGDKGKLLKTIPLVPGGDKIPVKERNKRRYLTLLARHRLGLLPQPHLPSGLCAQMKALAEGFYAIIPAQLLEAFDEGDLELLVCGMPEVPLPDFKANVQYEVPNPHGVPLIQWFWQCVENMSQEERARLLQFITGSTQVPPGGFGSLSPKVTIKLNHSPPSHLPVSHTCFNSIELPQYPSFEVMQERLALALKEGSEGFGEA